MEREPVKSFNAALVSFHESREAPSKAKIEELSKAALKAKMHYKFIVFSIEKFLPKCKIERRLHVLYLIDSIVRASKRRFKENDVYGKRFLEKLSSCLPYLLQCKQKERLRVIRTLNLWQSNSIFTEEELKPFRERCRDDGLIIDFEEVEKAVKGGKADMKIYGGGYIKKDKPAKAVKSTTPTMPPPPDDGLLGAGPGLMPHIPDLPAFPLSEDRINGTINEREMLELIQRFHIDKATLFSKDREMLHNALHFFVARLVQKVDAANSERDQERNRRATNIKNVLTKDFEYSDDEDEDRDKKASEEDPDEIKNLNHDEIFAIAVNLMETNDEINLGIVHIVNSRINAITTASKIIREQIASSAPAPMMQQPPPNQTMTGLQQPQQQLGLPGMPGLTPQQQLNAFQNIHPALLQNQAQLLMQQGRLPQLNPQNLLVLGNPLLQGFPPGLGLGIPNGPPPNAQPNGAQQQLDLVKLGMGHLGIPGVPGVPPNMIPPELQAVLNQQKMLAEMAENKGAIELNMAAPPPPGIPNFSTAPPPPGVQHRGVPPPSFDPNKPPPMTGMGLNMPPAVPFGTPNTFRGGFRGGRGGFDGGRGGFDGGRGGFDGGRRMEGGRGPVPQPGTSNGFDISRRGGFEGGRGGFRNEGRRYNDESRGSGDRNDDRRDRDRERFNDRQTDRRRVEDDNNSRRRVSRWNDSDRRDDNRRRSGEGEREREREPRRRERSRSVERRQRRSPSYSNGDEKAAINEQTQQEQRSSVDDEIVSSTTFDEVKPATVTEVKTEDQITEPKASVDQTDEVPMDLE